MAQPQQAQHQRNINIMPCLENVSRLDDAQCRYLPRCSCFINTVTLIPPFHERPPDALEALTLLFADYVKIVNWTQNISLHRLFITVWDWSKKWHLLSNPTRSKCLKIGREVPPSLSFFRDEPGIPTHDAN